MVRSTTPFSLLQGLPRNTPPYLVVLVYDPRTALNNTVSVKYVGGMAPVMGTSASRGLMVYLRTLKVALDDGIVTDDEMAILDVLAG